MLRIQPTAVAARGCSRQHECATTILPCGRPPSTAAAIATGVEENVFHRRYLHSPYLRLMSLRSGSARRLSAVRRVRRGRLGKLSTAGYRGADPSEGSLDVQFKFKEKKYSTHNSRRKTSLLLLPACRA